MRWKLLNELPLANNHLRAQFTVPLPLVQAFYPARLRSTRAACVLPDFTDMQYKGGLELDVKMKRSFTSTVTKIFSDKMSVW